MTEPSELQEEQLHLSNTVRRLRERGRVSKAIDSTVAAVDEQKQLMWEHRRDMDGSEHALPAPCCP